jgi:hypothetical protein
MTEKNEAAERLRKIDPDGATSYLLDKALAAERRATVERIRPRIARAFSTHAFENESTEAERGLIDFIRDAMLAILDEEAAR